MNATRRPTGSVLFAEDFDAPAPPQGAPEPELEPEIIEPVFSAADLEAARGKAWQAGYDAATADMAQSQASTAIEALISIAAHLSDARAQATTVAEQAADTLARLLMDSMAVAFPSLCARHGKAELLGLIRTILPGLSCEPAVTVRLNMQDAAAVEREIERFDPDLAVRTEIVPSDTIAPGDVRITWRGGQAVRNAAELWTHITEILAPSGLISYATVREMEHVE